MKGKSFLELLTVFLFSFFVYSANIGGLYIYSLDEAKNSECAREMLERGDLIVPTFNYELRTDKPPVHYYFMMIAYKFFGVNEFSARFFSSFFGALLVLITFLFSKRYFGYKVAFLSSLGLVSSIHMAVQFHMAVPDPYLIFWINASLFSFFVWYKERKLLFLYLFYLFTGIGVLTKGPVAVVLPFLTVFLFLFVIKRENLTFVKEMKLLKGILLISAVSLPWYIAVYMKTNGEWVKEFILKHNIHRFSQPMEGHDGFFALTFIYVFVGMLPFSVFIIQTFKKVWDNRKNEVLGFLLLFFTVYTVFFSISKTKLPNYTVPVYPSLAILISYYLSSIKRASKSFYISLIFYIFLTLLIVVALYYGIKGEKEIKDLSYLSFYFLLLPVGGVLSVLFLRRNLSLSIASLSLSSVFVSILFFFFLYPKIDKRNPVAKMLPLIDTKKEVRFYQSFNPAFVFYIRKHIKPVKKQGLNAFFSSSDRVYLLSRKKYKKDILKVKNANLLKEVKDLFENKTSVLFSNVIK